MDLQIKVCTNDNCKVIILDETGTGENGYLPESSTAIVKNRLLCQLMSYNIIR